MTSLNGSFQGLIPKEPKILARSSQFRQMLKMPCPSGGSTANHHPYNVCTHKLRLTQRTRRPGLTG